MTGRPLDATGLLRDEAEALMAELGQSRYRGRQLFQWVQARRVTNLGAMTTLPRTLRATLAERISVSRPVVVREQRAADGTRKVLFGLRDGEEIESVLIPDEDRLTACVSTQVGCALACRFCLTGLMGMRRNLTPAEIVGEVLALQDSLEPGTRISNMVLMGMGEPLLNFRAVERALRILCDEYGAGFSPRRITLSTAGHVESWPPPTWASTWRSRSTPPRTGCGIGSCRSTNAGPSPSCSRPAGRTRCRSGGA